MNNFCFGVVGFCLHFSILTLARQQFVASLLFVVLMMTALALGTYLNESRPMKSNPRPTPDHPSSGQHNADKTTKLEVLPTPAVNQPAVAVPDIFDEDRIRQDLARFANAPGAFSKYVERARSRFNKVGERALLEQWICYFDTGRRLVESRTELEKQRSAWLQLANEHEVQAREKQSSIARHEADAAEHTLRRDIAEYKRQHVELFIEGAQILNANNQPKLTPEQQRRLRRLEIEDKLKELDHLEDEALKNARNGEDRVRIENMYADKRDDLREQLAKNLI